MDTYLWKPFQLLPECSALNLEPTPTLSFNSDVIQLADLTNFKETYSRLTKDAKQESQRLDADNVQSLSVRLLSVLRDCENPDPFGVPAQPKLNPVLKNLVLREPIEVRVEVSPPEPVQTDVLGFSKDDPIDQSRYKTQRCPDSDRCSRPFCSKYHAVGEKRRVQSSFKAQLCPELGSCHRGEECQFAHTLPEYLYHPDQFKKTSCPLPMTDSHKCELGNSCSFHHSKARPKDHIEQYENLLVKMLRQVMTEQERLEELLQHYEAVKAQREQLVRKSYCSQCLKDLKAYIRYPCGHGFCDSCNSLSVIQCARCGQRGMSVRINYSV